MGKGEVSSILHVPEILIKYTYKYRTFYLCCLEKFIYCKNCCLKQKYTNTIKSFLLIPEI